MDAAQALSDLTEISSQIEAALILDADGSVLAATVSEERAAEMGQTAQELLAAVRRVPGDDDRELAQVEVATPNGSVFLVRDDERTIAATTGPEPTVGLVFYDLKSTLRSFAAPKPKPRRKKTEPAPEPDAAA